MGEEEEAKGPVSSLPRASLAVRRSAHLPKLKEIRNRVDSYEVSATESCSAIELI